MYMIRIIDLGPRSPKKRGPVFVARGTYFWALSHSSYFMVERSNTESVTISRMPVMDIDQPSTQSINHRSLMLRVGFLGLCFALIFTGKYHTFIRKRHLSVYLILVRL
jgi:hypothetical protein